MRKGRQSNGGRRTTWLVGGAIIIVLGALGYFLSDLFTDSGGDGDMQTVTAESTAGDLPEIDPLALTDDAAPTELQTPTIATVVPELEQGRGPPASYTAALGGITGRVLEEDGTPVPDLPLEIIAGRPSQFLMPRMEMLEELQADLDLIAGTAVTDAEGRFFFEHLDPRILGGLLLDPGGPRTVLRILEMTPSSGAVRDIGDIVLPGTVTMSGRIVDDQRRPVAGVRVRATDLEHTWVSVGILFAEYREGGAILIHEENLERPILIDPPGSIDRLTSRLPLPTTQTDADGRFSLQVPPGMVTMIADDGRHAANSAGPFPTGAAGGERDVGAITIYDGTTFNGRVVDRDGAGVVDAEVYVGNTFSLAPVSIMRPPTRTDENGNFQMEGMRMESVYVAARAPGDAAHVFLGDLSPDQKAIIQLPGKTQLKILAVDEFGETVDDVQLFGRALRSDVGEALPSYLKPIHALGDRTRRDEDGLYVVEGLTPAPWTIQGRSEGRAVTQVEVLLETAEEANVTLTFEPATTLEVTVFGPPAGKGDPVDWARATVFERGEDFPLVSARTNENGWAELPALADGEYALMVTHPAYAIAWQEFEVPDVDELNVALTPGGSILGTVLDNGEPPRIPVLVSMQGSNSDALDSEMPRLAITDADGLFSFHQVEPGEVQLEVRDRVTNISGFSFWEAFVNSPLAQAQVEVPEEGEVETLLIVGSEYEDMDTARVTGRLRVNGSAVPGWKIRCWGQIRRSATTDAEGNFELGIVASGETQLAVSPPGAGMSRWGGIASRRLELEPDERRFVEINVETGSVSGWVRSGLNGSRLENARLRLVPVRDEKDGGFFGTQSTVTTSNGAFLFDMVEQGKYQLRAELEGFASTSSETFELRALQSRTGMELTLSRALSIAGRVVVDGVSEKPQWIFLIAEQTDGSARENTRPDQDDMRFEFDSLSPGTYQFQLATDLDDEFAVVEHTLTGDTDSLLLTFTPMEDTDQGFLDPESD